MLKNTFTLALSLLTILSFSQSRTKRVLFLGNSYTYVNDLPKTLADVALSNGDTVIYDSNCPGGYTLQGHTTNVTSLSKIAQGKWDFVVLQEQSQFPSFPIYQVETDVFPYAHQLDSLIHVNNPCAETVFYMTWGRKNGDASNCSSWPPVCTYEGMDSLLQLRYEMMATANKAIISPVSVVWKYLRSNAPQIELYQSDESHPSMAGTYAAACSFYSTLFRKDPTSITLNSTLLPADATTIRNAAKLSVFHQLPLWHVGEYDPKATFTNTALSNNQIQFTNTSANANIYQWYFGDGDSTSDPNPSHNYNTTGTYNVKLIASNCTLSDTFVKSVTIVSTSILKEKEAATVSISPNPVHTLLTLNQSIAKETDFTIYAISGSLVKTGTLHATEYAINVEELKPGNYFIVIQKSKKETISLPFYRSND